MPISWNEIKDRALRFSKEWATESSEEAEGKTFLNEFFNVFGISRRRVATFEHKTKKIDGKEGYIDLLWRGVLLVELKSRGKSLDRAYQQATGYFPHLKEVDLPRFILVSDFARFRLYDLETDSQRDFALNDLYKNVKQFGFIAGYQTREYKAEDPANIKAAELMGQLYDRMKAVGYEGHPLQVYLVRLLFCLFAEDTSIFEKRQFLDFIEHQTAEDGHDLGRHLAALFHILNTPETKRLKNLDEELAAYPYVNGRLFAETLPPASFDRAMRESLLECCALDWSRISPAIFGSLFQSVMDKQARRNLGAHYTTERNILKVIRPLFLDELWAKFEKARKSAKLLREFHRELAAIAILDPACGCGNFLVIAYRELRLLELAVLRALHREGQKEVLDLAHLVLLDVDRFFGIEVEDFPSQIAQVALWLTDHQMNMRISEEFGHYFRRLPLAKSPTIVKENALTLDWWTIVQPAKLSSILGNPPFIGKQHQTERQKTELAALFPGLRGVGELDYVAGWYAKAADFIAGTKIGVAFVSTNSLVQGEQTGILWPYLKKHHRVSFTFAHRTFRWSSEARGKAAVHCVIIGFGNQPTAGKTIYDYEDIAGEPQLVVAERINSYLVDAPEVHLVSRSGPICGVPAARFGNMPNDGGHLLLTDEEKQELMAAEPGAAKWLRPFLGAEEFLNRTPRWCLWLVDIKPDELKQLPRVAARVAAVKSYREASKREATKKLALYPTRFGEIRQSGQPHILVPRHSSEKRLYIPFGFFAPEVIVGDSNLFIPEATLYHFGILQSRMHMAWVRQVCGRLESRFRYSSELVYNNYPWPAVSNKQREGISEGAQAVLDARAEFPDSSLADLYDPVRTPVSLVKAHLALDKAVDAAYSKDGFRGDQDRIAFLFKLYQSITEVILNPEPK